MKILAIFSLLLSIGCYTLGYSFVDKGFDKKDNYSNPESFAALIGKNNYVGGDAYNYIINSGYFTGYNVLGGTCFICGTIFTCCGFIIFGLSGIKKKLPE